MVRDTESSSPRVGQTDDKPSKSIATGCPTRKTTAIRRAAVRETGVSHFPFDLVPSRISFCFK